MLRDAILDNQCEYNPPLSEQDLKFNFRSGMPCLYLVETFGEWTRRRYDRILNGEVWNTWLKLIDFPTPTHTATTKDLTKMAELRRAIYGMGQSIVKNLPPLETDIQVINHFASFPTPQIQLSKSGDQCEYSLGISQEQILSLFARDAIQLFSGEFSNRIRECKSHICPVVFVDKSRRGDRQWCSTNCGARHATAKYREKLKDC